MHKKTIVFLSTVLTTSFGMFFIIALILISAIKGWGAFGEDPIEPSIWDVKRENEEYDRDREENPELYSEPEDLFDYLGEN